MKQRIAWSSLLMLFVGGCLQPLYDDPPQSNANPGANTRTNASTVVSAAQPLPPRVMFVVDKSASMTDPASGSESGQGCLGPDDRYDGNRTTDCKWNDLLQIMTGNGTPANVGYVRVLNEQLRSNGVPATLGLTYFAGDDQCGTGDVAVPLTTGVDSAEAITSALGELIPAGATPAAATMQLLADHDVFPCDDDRDNYAILLTDGAPNCDASLVATETRCGGDRCTEACSTWDSGCMCNPATGGYSLLCLDDTGLVSAVTQVKAAGIGTFVVGIGRDIDRNPATVSTLNAAAQAGGFPRNDTSELPRYFYPANDMNELSSALLGPSGVIVGNCRFSLAPAAPENFSQLDARVDGVDVHIDTGSYELTRSRQSLNVTNATACELLRLGESLQFVFTP
jgi:hypothetical protein